MDALKDIRDQLRDLRKRIAVLERLDGIGNSVDLVSAQTIAGIKTFSDPPVFSDGIKMLAQSISDDNVFSFTPDATTGLFWFYHSGGQAALVTFRAVATVFCTSLAATALVNTTTGVLTGTTGTDGRITISAHTTGLVYVENRLGGTISIKYLHMT